MSARMFSRRPAARPAGRPSRAGGRRARPAVDVGGDVADGEHVRGSRRRTGRARRRGGHPGPAAAPLSPARSAAVMPPAHTTVRRQDLGAVATASPGRRRSRRRRCRAGGATPTCSRLGRRVGVRLVGERPQHDRCRGRRGRCGSDRGRGRGSDAGMTLLIRSASAPGGLDAGGAGADDHEVQRALVDAGRGRGRPPRTPRRSGPQALGVGHRVEREGVLRGAGGVEEVGLRPGGQHQVVGR